MKERKIFRFLGILFLIIALITIGIGIVLQIRNNQFFKTTETTEAYIDDIVVSERTNYSHSSKKHRRKTTHTVYVSYEIDGTTYDNVSLNYYSSDMQKGDTITIHYAPEHPYDIQTKGTQYLAILIPSILGFIFALVGFILLIIYFRFQKKKKLITTGTCMKLPIVKIGIHHNVHVNGHPGYYVASLNKMGLLHNK